jgi:RHS repeat-associated protein
VGKETYRYDGHGRRVLNSRSVPGNELTVSHYSQSGQLMYQEQTGRGSLEHVYLGGSLIATRENGGVKYQHTDALGSPVAVTNAAGQVVERTNWEPYGAAIGKTIDGIGYTGHAMDAATGLTYMQQRYYDPICGCFLSVDPVTAYSNGDMRFFNRYAYAFNNPYKFTDPDGREAEIVPVGISYAEAQRYMWKIMFSPTARAEMAQIEASPTLYRIAIGNDLSPGYTEATRTLRLNPVETFRIKSSGKIQSTAVNGGHEITHLAQRDRIGHAAFSASLIPPVNKDGSRGVSPEEVRATEVEKEIGKDLGLPTRSHYRDHGERIRCGMRTEC